jgi:hypothetical protein
MKRGTHMKTMPVTFAKFYVLLELYCVFKGGCRFCMQRLEQILKVVVHSQCPHISETRDFFSEIHGFIWRSQLSCFGGKVRAGGRSGMFLPQNGAQPEASRGPALLTYPTILFDLPNLNITTLILSFRRFRNLDATLRRLRTRKSSFYSILRLERINYLGELAKCMVFRKRHIGYDSLTGWPIIIKGYSIYAHSASQDHAGLRRTNAARLTGFSLMFCNVSFRLPWPLLNSIFRQSPSHLLCRIVQHILQHY